jgi:O-antigen/teichoic acid export membrane protein
MKKIAPFVALASSFILAQGLVQALTLVVGLLLARVLPLEQYALYTISGTLLALVSLGSNFGLGHALISLGAGRRDNPGYVGALFNAARSDSHRLFGVAVLATVALAGYMFRGGAWPLHTQAACVALVLSIGPLGDPCSICTMTPRPFSIPGASKGWCGSFWLWRV